jgi:multidrug efflux pump subunit AcrB
LERLIRGLNTRSYVDGKLVELPDGEQRLENMASFVGTGGPFNFAGLFPKDGGSHYGIIWIKTMAGEQVPQFVQDIRRAAAEGIGQPGDPDYVAPIAGARVVPHQLISGVPVKTPIDIRLLGPRDGSERVLRAYGKQIADVVRESGLAWDVHTSWGEFTRQLDVEVDQDKANLAGVTNTSVLLSLNAFYSGHPLINFREGDKQIPVMLRLPPKQRGTLDELDAVFVEGLTGKVPLNSIAKIERKGVNGKIHRNQRSRCFSIGAEPEDGLLFSQVLEGVQPKLDEISKELPPGYRIEQGGTKEEADKGLRMNVGALGIGVICVYFLLVIQFNSVIKPIMIGLTVPLSAGGGLLGLYMMGVAMGFMETVGFLALFGIVLSAAILLIDFSELLIKEKVAKGEGLAAADEKSYCGLNREAFFECLAQAGQLRLMPILMTTLTTVGGLLSLMFGGPLFKGMATVIVIGLSIGTLFTLFVQPAVYAIFVDLGMKLEVGEADEN